MYECLDLFVCDCVPVRKNIYSVGIIIGYNQNIYV